jgi:hypothetical protein
MSGTINTIPASTIVDIIPSVLSAGGAALDLIELMLTTNTRVPIGRVLSFPPPFDVTVGAYFGATSTEAVEATVYGDGFIGSTALPAALLFAQYPIANVGAYLRGGPVSSLTLAQLQALSGVLTVTIDGTPHTSSAINLSAATSFSNASELITTALGLTGPTDATITAAAFGATFTATGSGTNLTVTSVTGTIHPGTAASATITGTGVPATTWIVSQTSGTIGGAGVYVTNNATTSSAASITCTSNVVDVATVASGTIAIGQQIEGTSVTAGTYVTALGTGAGGAGTYIATQTQGVASEAMTTVTPVVTYDSVSGAFVVISSTTGASSTIGYGSGTISAGLALTLVTGAITSQGAVAGVPATFMSAITAQTQNWATFQTLFDPDAGSGNAQKQLFAAWTNAQNNRYAYLAWDNDITPTESTDAATSLGQILKASNSSGTACIYEPTGSNLHLAAFLGGFAASVDFNATNGRATAAFKSQSGLGSSVTNAMAAANLIANGYNFYGTYATANQDFEFYYPGQITGPFAWFDSYINQIWLNNQLQLTLLGGVLTVFKSIPYTPAGYAILRQALTGGADTATIALPPASPVAQAINNGVIRQGVPLSAAQAAYVNAACGMTVDGIISTVGFYLLIQPATAQVRAARQTPPMTLFYTDGGSIQQITLGSVLIQ